MHAGHVISGGGHLALIGWMFLGGLFGPTPEPVEVTEVAVISSAEFAALTDAARRPEVIDEVALPAAPEVTPDAPEVDAAPPEQDVATPAPPTSPQPEPESPSAPEVSEAAPESPEPPAEVNVDAPDVSERPVERPVDRIAPTPTPAPQEDSTPDVQTEPAVQPEETSEPVEETPPQEETQTPEATDRVVIETPQPPRAAVEKSLRPPARRPKPPVRRESTQTAQNSNDASDATDDAVRAALQAAQSSADNTVPTGPPMTSGEKDALRLSVQKCWNVDQGAASARVVVTVGMSMQQNGKLVGGSLRLLSSEGGDSAAKEAAFQAARRAILRCQGNGYDLPADKYGQWKEIEMTFNPERMRIR